MPTLEAPDVDELEGKVRYQLGRALYLSDADLDAGTVVVGNTIPRDVTDYDAEDPERTLKFFNVRIMETDLKRTEEGVAVTLPERDELVERYNAAVEQRDDIPEPRGEQ